MARPRALRSTSSSRQLCALSRTPTWKPTSSFLPSGRGADQHQHALGLRLHPRLQVDAVGPEIDVAPGRQVAPLPARVVRLPFAPQPRDHRGRQVRRVLAQQRSERLLEVAHRDPAQVEDRQQGIQAPRPPRPARQDGRGEADALGSSAGAAVAQLDPPHRDRADPGLDQALRTMAVPHHALAPVRQPRALHRGQERLGFRLDRLGQQPAGAAPQDGRQRILDRRRAGGGGQRCYRSSWRIAPSGGSGRLVTRLDTPPFSHRHHPVSAIARPIWM